MRKKILYLNQDSAARAFGCEALPLTAIDARERGAVLYPVYLRERTENGQYIRIKRYTYGRIFTGRHNNVVTHVVLRYLLWLLVPMKISILHTHPFCTGHRSEEMSKGDELVARLWGVMYMYLASPAGNLYKYDGKNGKRDSRGVLILEKIYDSMPKISIRVDCKKSLPAVLTVKDIKRITKNNQAYLECIKTDV